MAIDILMPALSPTMESGTLSKWTIAVGDPVRSGDVIAEIETDKATMEVEAVDDGVLASILVADGSDGVAVGTVIARLAEDGEAVEDVASAAVPPPAPVSPAPVSSAPVSDPAEASAASQIDAVSADPVPAAAAPVQLVKRTTPSNSVKVVPAKVPSSKRQVPSDTAMVRSSQG